MLWWLWQSRAPSTILVTFSTHANSDVRFGECLTLMLEHSVISPLPISWALWSQRPDLLIKRTNSESINSRRVPQTEISISRHLAIEHFQIDNVSWSWSAGYFRHPVGGEVPSPWTRLDSIDSRFVRFRSRSDSNEFFMKKYLKTKKLEHFPKVRFFFVRKNLTFSSKSGGTSDPTTIVVGSNVPPKKSSFFSGKKANFGKML